MFTFEIRTVADSTWDNWGKMRTVTPSASERIGNSRNLFPNSAGRSEVGCGSFSTDLAGDRLVASAHKRKPWAGWPKGIVAFSEIPVIQALKLGLESCATNSPSMNGLPSSRCCRTSREAHAVRHLQPPERPDSLVHANRCAFLRRCAGHDGQCDDFAIDQYAIRIR